MRDKEDITKLYQQLYKNEKTPFGKDIPPRFRESLHYIHKGSLLDIGGGYGRFSLYFVQKGIEVTNLDENKDAIEMFNKKVDKIGKTAESILQNIVDFSFIKTYDNICCINILHLLDPTEARRVIKEMQENTNTEGINYIAGFLNQHNAIYPKFQEVKNIFLRVYNNWDILYYKQMEGRNLKEQILPYFILVAKKVETTIKNQV